MTNFRVISVPSFKKEIERIKDGKHLELITKAIDKIENMGKNALKILDSQKGYLLCEVKFKHPPYRLYVMSQK